MIREREIFYNSFILIKEDTEITLFGYMKVGEEHFNVDERMLKKYENYLSVTFLILHCKILFKDNFRLKLCIFS